MVGGSGSRARWARGRRSVSRCPFGLTKRVRTIRAEASPHGHDVSPVPGRQPRRRTILPRVRRTVSRCLRCLWRSTPKITREYVNKLEAGRYDPTVGVLQRLAKALGVPVTALLE
jgi:transcriptional regulator with XRE-family HTH domain